MGSGDIDDPFPNGPRSKMLGVPKAASLAMNPGTSQDSGSGHCKGAKEMIQS